MQNDLPRSTTKGVFNEFIPVLVDGLEHTKH